MRQQGGPKGPHYVQIKKHYLSLSAKRCKVPQLVLMGLFRPEAVHRSRTHLDDRALAGMCNACSDARLMNTSRGPRRDCVVQAFRPARGRTYVVQAFRPARGGPM